MNGVIVNINDVIVNDMIVMFDLTIITIIITCIVMMRINAMCIIIFTIIRPIIIIIVITITHIIIIIMKTHPVAGSVLFFSRLFPCGSRERYSRYTNGKPRASLRRLAVRTALSDARGVTASRGGLSSPGHCRARTIPATARGRAGGREKADDNLPDREVPRTAEGVRSGPSPRRWCLNPNDHRPDLNPSRFSLLLTALTAHSNHKNDNDNNNNNNNNDNSRCARAGRRPGRIRVIPP